MQVGLTHYLIISAILFSLGLYGVVTRRNAILVLMGIELIFEFRQYQFYSVRTVWRNETGRTGNRSIRYYSCCR